jgi:hypothetical protein
VDLCAQGFLKRPLEHTVLLQELQRILSRTV